MTLERAASIAGLIAAVLFLLVAIRRGSIF